MNFANPTSIRHFVVGLAVLASLLLARHARAAGPSFRQDVVPVLTKAGCNAGACHGKLAGQNGFKLSLRGYAPEWDYDSIVSEIGSRRIDFSDPASSLLLQKAAGQVAHEGGKRFALDSQSYKTILEWIEARAPGPIAEDVDPASLEVTPPRQVLAVGQSQQLKVLAHYPDGHVRDVTWLAVFYSNDPTTIAVNDVGLATSKRHGEASIRAHFQTLVSVVTLTTPFDQKVDPSVYQAQNNVIDQHVFAKLKDLQVPPSGPTDDAAFIRRVYLDLIGTLPAPAEVHNFVNDKRPDKRSRLIDDLLERPEWADYWSLQIGDLLQNRKERDHDVRGAKGVRDFKAWLRSELAADRPWDVLSREVLTATGDCVQNPAVGYYIVTIGEDQEVEKSTVTDSVAQAFLGTRIGCARCHNHPLERYTQDDFYHFAAFFSRVRLARAGSLEGTTVLTVGAREERDRQKDLDQIAASLADAKKAAESKEGDELKKATKRIEEKQKQLADAQKSLDDVRTRVPTVNQPRTGKPMAPQTLDHTLPEFKPGSDPRVALAEWITSPQNDAFAGTMVNRLWKHFMGVGMVEPVDDIRSSNPPTNPELWKAMIGAFVEHKYDLKYVMRLILNSRAYQLDSSTLAENVNDNKFYSHYYARRLPAEVLLDAVCSATGVPDEFAGYPVGLRAVQLPEPSVGSYFLTLFGRSERVTACACERNGDITLPQLLHLSNGQDVQAKITSADGRLSALLKNQKDDEQVTREIFLTTLGKPPTEAQSKAVKDALGGGDGREAVFADLFWALLNSKEFSFNR